MASLNTRTWVSVAIMAVVMTALVFLPAGTLHYWQGWVYLALFFGLAIAITVDVRRRDPALLKRRLKGGPTAEPRPLQRVLMLGASIGFIGLLVVPGLDVRYHWSAVPTWAVVLGDVLFVVGFGFVGRVYRENTFGAATIQVAKGQRVISTGPYAVVRHPMYASASIYLIGSPLALASYWAFAALAFMLPFLIWRLLDEERLLACELPGYAEYQRRVRYRLVPGIW